MRSFRLRAFNISSIASQTQELIPGGLVSQRFEAKLTMPTMPSDAWRELDGLIAALAGTGGKVRLWDHARPQPYYNKVATETQANWDTGSQWDGKVGWSAGLLPPLVTVGSAAVRGATDMLLSGFPASLDAVLRRGDLFEIRPNGSAADYGHLYLCTGTMNSNSDGDGRVYFMPGLRRGVAAGDVVVLGAEAGPFPSSVFRLSSDDEGLIDVQAPDFGVFGLTLIEVLPHT